MKKLKESSRSGFPDKPLKIRQEIFRLRECGRTIQEIAEILKCSKSTVSNTLNHESLKRVSSRLPWYEKGKIVAEAIKYSRGRPRSRQVTLKTQETLDSIVEYLKDKHSPQSASRKLKEEKPHLSISHEWIYQYIYRVDPTLLQYLDRRGRTVRNRKYQGRKTRAVRREVKEVKNTIHERSIEGDQRLTLGHFESDFIVSCRGGKSCLLVFADRRSRKLNLRLLPNREAETARQSIFGILNGMKSIKPKSLTVDNDTAHNNLRYLEPIFKDSDLKILFCDPYKAWQRGTIEAINGILRRWFPKGTNFDLVTKDQVEYVEKWFNARPMKALGWISPNKAEEIELQKAA